MKQSNFSLADVLTLLTALAFGFICFLGKNFYTMGNTSESISWAVIISVSLAGTALAAKLLKRTSRNFKTNFILEIVCLLLFTALMVYFSYTVLPHYFNVSDKKTEIQTKLYASISQAENMFDEYERYAENRKSNYRGQLETASDTKSTGGREYIEYGFISGVADTIQIKNKVFTLHSDLYPVNYNDTTNNKGIKKVATTWLSKAKFITNNWKPIGIVNVVNDVEKNSNDWLNQLKGFSQQVNVKGENSIPFVYSLSFEDIKTHFTKSGNPTLISIGLAGVAYILMLLSWFVTKRHSRNTGLAKTAPYEVAL